MLSIKVQPQNPYHEQLEQFLMQDFPANLDNKDAILDALTTAIVGTCQVRYGSMPNPESLVVIRQVIMEAIDRNIPIPILMPWGSKKPNNDFSIDTAEVAALKQLECLNRRVSVFHAPGIDLRIRVEDVSGYYLFQNEGEPARAASERYVNDLIRLINVLNLPFITPVLESDLMEEHEFNTLASELEPLFLEYLTDTDKHGLGNYFHHPAYVQLLLKGWQGMIPTEQRDYYRERYQRSHPDASRDEQTLHVARYFATVLARRIMNAVGNDPTGNAMLLGLNKWHTYIQVTFAAPVPGMPKSLAQRIVYYRTVPMRHARTHIPPWRARGYVTISDHNVCPKLATWQDPLTADVCYATYSRDTWSVDVRIDHIVTA